ncbi:putative sugar transporter STL1 [Hyaloscypha bicolor E]|uniref:Putative sugar transporter STL1 n=1 Tax=Hyaloscypha bicolor E TaxID=1095630 RepID=A0A2J6SUH1_9HELO|nr:putative sugar transporter STL1 [Hyaloscypha bicolor E]PMD54417.1 putative sugar transporter STL1 [Hyaloscypha bicolor E]
MAKFTKARFGSKTSYRMMSISCALAFALYGYDAGVLGGVQNTKPFLDAIGNPTGVYDIPMVASSYVLAATVISALVIFIGMPFGRRGCILIGDMCVIVGSAIQASAMSMPHIIVGRVICGFGIGFISSTVPTYMAEMGIMKEQRGPEVAIQCAWLITGIAIAYWIDFGFTRTQHQISWRFPIAFQAVFAIISFALLWFLPDTPRWYYARDRIEEGDLVLMLLHDKGIDGESVQKQRKEILSSIQMEAENENKLILWSLVWDNTELRVGRRIRISFLILSIQQMMGINMLVYYSTRIFANIGLSPFLSQLLAAVMNTIFAIGTYFTPGTIERFGRRQIMLWTAFGCGVSIMIFTIMIGLPNQTPATQWTAVAFVILYNLFYGYGWVGCPWLYGPEIAPLRYRHIGGAAGSLGEWLFSFITVFAGGIGVDRTGWKIWIWQIIACFGVIPFVYFMCPETAGKSLEEIDALFAAPGYDGYHHGAGADEKIIESDGSNTSHLEEKIVGKN